MNGYSRKILVLIGAVLIGGAVAGANSEKVAGNNTARLCAAGALQNISPPAAPVRLIFIHHSTGENWLSDDNGQLGAGLRDNNYFVSDTNYGWGPDDLDWGGETIGDHTDLGNWYSWFRGPHSQTYLSALYAESGQNCSYSRLDDSLNPGGENEIIMFKSCFPNSNLQGDQNDPVPPISSNPLRGMDSSSEYHTVANAKGIYLDLLDYFRTRQDKLFIVITAPPVSDPSYADNARAFNNWLVDTWLTGYPYNNVFVFDFYNVLTTNGGIPMVNDLDQEEGNHHRWWNNDVQHKTDGDSDANPNVSEYATALDDDHPNRAGNLKATGEFILLLNLAYNRWKQGGAATTTTANSTTTSIYEERPCVMVNLYGKDSPETNRLRSFRDRVLSKTAAGREIISLYYRLSPGIVTFLETKRGAKAELKSIIDTVMPVMRKKFQ